MELVFICTGNVCRSSMAEGLARHMWEERWGARRDLTVSSAGVAAWPGETASPQAVFALGEKGIDLRDHRSRPLSSEIMDQAGLILAMTRSHKEIILEHFPEASNKVFMLAEYAGLGEKDVKDPYGESRIVYQACAEELATMITLVLERIARESGVA